MPRLLITGRFKASKLIAEIRAGTSPANHLLAASVLDERGWEVSALELTERELASSRAFQWRVWREQSRFDAILAYNYHDIRLLGALKLLGLLRPTLTGLVHVMKPRPWERITTAGCERLFVLSRAAVNGLAQCGAVSPRTVYFPYGADERFYHELPWTDVASIVLSVGVTGRDFATLIAAARQIDAPVHIVGRVAKQDIESAPANVTFHSSGNYDLPFSSLLALYQRAACVVVAHHGNENPNGLNAVMEALALGRPLVLTAGPGMDIDVDAMACGHMVPAGNPSVLAERVNRIVADPALARTMGRNARQQVERVYNTQRMADILDRELRAARD